MSHRVTIAKTDIRDPAIVAAACARLQLGQPQAVKRYNLGIGGPVDGLQVWLKGREGEKAWVKPIICDTEAGALHYDNWSGVWGNIARLHEFMDAYAIEAIRSQAALNGALVTETALEDGSIELVVHHAGSA